MQMDAGLDTGPVLLAMTTPIGDEETGGQLHDRLAELGASVLADGLALRRADVKPMPWIQPEAGVTYAHKLDKAEARLDWSQPAAVLARKVRAFEPWPVAEAVVAGERLRLHHHRCGWKPCGGAGACVPPPWLRAARGTGARAPAPTRAAPPCG